MDNLHDKPSLRLLMLIVNHKDLKRAEELLDDEKVSIQYVYRAEGTVSNEILDFFGLEPTEKAILTCVVVKQRADEVLNSLEKGLSLNKPNRGLAFTFPISGVSALFMKILSEEMKEKIMEHMERGNCQMMSEAKYSLLMITVNQGYSEDVMTAAKDAGAMGGTIVHALQLGTEEPMKRWGISVLPEKEIIYILVELEKKIGIMKAVSENCGLNTEARGMIVSIPVDAVAGLNSPHPAEKTE